MRYFVGYLLEGQAVQWHARIAQGISERFKTENIHEKVSPHITLFKPFEAQSLNQVRSIILKWMRHYGQHHQFAMNDFGQFVGRVIFAAASIDPEAVTKVLRLQQELEAADIVPINMYPPQWHPHVSLLRHIDAQQFEKTWNYVLMLPKPDFVFPFDNVTLFRSEGGGAWSIQERLQF